MMDGYRNYIHTFMGQFSGSLSKINDSKVKYNIKRNKKVKFVTWKVKASRLQ